MKNEEGASVESPPVSWHRSPLTDPRSLASSLTFHLVLLTTAASLMALRAAMPAGPPPPKVLQAELGPIDNRVPAEAGGGFPGEIGGVGQTSGLNIRAEVSTADKSAALDPLAESLLADVLPAPPPSNSKTPVLPGPSTGIGVLPGPGIGGGGGSGGGSGGGIGRGIGPATEFFGARERAGSFTYVIDCSGSMSGFGALRAAKQELLASLGQLPPDARFAVVFFNLRPTIFADASGQPALMPATLENKDRVRTRLESIKADGGTRPMAALEAALELKPEVVFLLTDGQELSHENVEELRSRVGSIRIHTIEFGAGPAVAVGAGPLQELAAATGGSFRHVDVTKIGKAVP